MKEKKTKYSYFYLLKRLSWYLRNEKKQLIYLLFLIVGETGFLTIAPLFIKNITNSFKDSIANSTGVDFPYVIRMLIYLAVFYLIGSLCSWLDNRLCVKLSQIIIKGLRDKAQRKLQVLFLNYIDTHPGGDILSRVTNDMVTLSNTLDSTLMKLVSQLLTILGVLIVMFYMNPLLALVFILMIPVSYFALNKIMSATKPLFKSQQKNVGELNSFINDIYSNHVLMEAFSYEAAATEQFTELNREFFGSYVKSRFYSGFILPVTKLVNNLAYIALCILSGVLMIQGKLTIGELQAFLIYANMISGPISNFSNGMNNTQTGLAAAERVLEFLDLPEEEKTIADQRIVIDEIRGEIVFEHIKFGYTDDHVLMKDVSFQAKQGMTMAIVGPSGAGKTTLVNLLMRFYEIQGGRITLDGYDISQLSKGDLRSVYGMVLQDTWIFEGTIADNIGYGKEGASRDDIIKAAEYVQCDSFIKKLPHGYDTIISAEDELLSAGEKQLLTIARTVLADPKILILDEATSQVDTKTEALITRAMERMMKDRTCFVIAHRLFTIMDADNIIFMMDGDIKEVGNHATLLKKNGLYAAMYHSALEES